MELSGDTLWFDPAAAEVTASPTPIPGVELPRVLLVPLYDELATYPKINFPVAPGHPHPPGPDLSTGSVIVDKVSVGTWRRTVRSEKVNMEAALAPQVSAHPREWIGDSCHHLAWFLDKELDLSFVRTR